MPSTEGHIAFAIPSDRNIKIWRYMDFTKYVALLSSRTLYFPAASQFSDPHEGSFSNVTVSTRSKRYGDSDISRIAAVMASQFQQSSINWTLISCWHMSEHESEAMWKLYSKSNEAIAIQSTYESLHQVLPEYARIGVVHYTDYGTDFVPDYTTVAPYLYKRVSFEHERELRAIIQDPPMKNGIPDVLQTRVGGRAIPVDLDLLIENIYVSPGSPGWFQDLVAAVTV